MEGEKFQQLGQLYARTGIATPAEVLEMRRNAALKMYEQLEEEHLVRLLRGSFGTTKPDELEFVTLALAQHDPSYDPVSGIREAQVVCCAMLREALGDSDSFAGAAALGLTSASFGGVRVAVDADLVQQAAASLDAMRIAPGGLPDSVPLKKRPNWNADLESIQPMVDAGQLKEAFPTIKKILEGSAIHTQSVAKGIAETLEKVLVSHRHLREQMEVHWWVLGKWSMTADLPFSSFSAPEAAIRAGLELCRLSTASHNGLRAAPALIIQALGDEVSAKRTSVKELATSGDREWRKGWAGSLVESRDALSLMPITAAIAMAVDAEDQNDWEPRYVRVMGFPADRQLSVTDAAVQLYNEQLFIRAIEQ